MGFLKAVGAWLLDYLFSRLKEWGVSLLELMKEDKKDAAENKELKEKLETSTTEEEQYDATEDLARKLRGRN